MVDHISAEKRSYIMSRIRSKNTGLELIIRRLVFSMGYRYRLYGKNLPGKPDLVFSGRKKIIFVHGCFWHQHKDCRMGFPPASNLEYWKPKLARTTERDKQHIEDLQKKGWDVLVIWECEIREQEKVKEKIYYFLGPAKRK
jgi:DNA mismatch endonuclease (patch repair protein)